MRPFASSLAARSLLISPPALLVALASCAAACGSSPTDTASALGGSDGGDATVVGASGGASSTSSSGIASDDGSSDATTSSSSGSSGGSSGASSSGGSSGVVDSGGADGDDGSVLDGAPVDAGADGPVTCAEGSTTSVSGTVYDPAGTTPLYDALVFVPSDATLPVITPGTSTCGACGASVGRYVAATTTDATGHFTLAGVPAGHVPIVAQIGKWRRETFVDLTPCQDNPQPAASIRMPRTRSEGDMPQIALLTGGCDDYGCLLTGMGIDASEFGPPHGGGRVDVYQGFGLAGTGGVPGPTLSPGYGDAGACTTSTCPLWASKQSLEAYDLVVLSCECGSNTQTKPSASMTALRDWMNEGGRVFASHFQSVWFANNPSADFQGTASWTTPSLITTQSSAVSADTSLSKTSAYAQWLGAVGALSDAGSVPVADLTQTVLAVNTTSPQATVRWAYETDAGSFPKLLSFETPIGGVAGSTDGGAPPTYCGQGVFTNVHTGDPHDASASNVPAGCTAAALTPQQKALEFLFFDLSGCTAPDSLAPPGPPPSGS